MIKCGIQFEVKWTLEMEPLPNGQQIEYQDFPDKGETLVCKLPRESPSADLYRVELGRKAVGPINLQVRKSYPRAYTR